MSYSIIDIDIAKSRSLLIIVLLAHVLAGTVVWFSGLRVVTDLLVDIMVFMHGWFYLKRYYWLTAHNSVLTVRMRGSDFFIKMTGQGWIKVNIDTLSLITPIVTVLVFAHGKRRLYSILFHDSVDASAYRRLRVRLLT